MTSLRTTRLGDRTWLDVLGRFPGEVVLSGSRITVGRDSADVELTDDSVSRLHAVFERLSSGWVVHDLGSTNGTTVNGARVSGAHVVRDGDIICFGSTTVTFRCSSSSDLGATAPPPAAPRVTVRERDLLVALCRPVLRGGMLAEPASLRQIAAELVVTESAVKKLLTRLYDRFELLDRDRRRAYLAAEALRRGVISTRDAQP